MTVVKFSYFSINRLLCWYYNSNRQITTFDLFKYVEFHFFQCYYG